MSRMLLATVSVVAIGAIVACDRSREASASPPAELLLESFGCFGSCPAFRVAISESGMMRWRGGAHVARRGADSARIDPEQARRIIQEFRRMRLTFLPRYLPKVTCWNPPRDHLYTRFVLREGADSTVVEHYEGCNYLPRRYYDLVLRIEDALVQPGWLERDARRNSSSGPPP